MKKNLLKKLLSVLLITSFTASLAGCQNPNADSQQTTSLSSVATSSEPVEVYDLSNETEESIRLSSADFAVNMLKETAAASTENTMISPFSIQSALAMTANGANGDTLTAMTNVLCGDNSIENLNAYMAAHMPDDNILTTANGIWVSDKYDSDLVNPDFKAINSDIYNAEFKIAKFDDTAINDINNFVNTNTNGMIPYIVNSLDSDAGVVLVNAIAFEGKWAVEYEDHSVIEGEDFNNINGSVSSITALYSEEDEYCSNINCTGFIKYYENQDYAFMALLPNEDMSLEDFINTLDGETLLNLYDNAEHSSVYAMIPEFTYSYEASLNNALINSGMEIAFTNGADFSNMIDSSASNLYIGTVYHKTFISVDRTGTKAAAATEVEMCDNAVALMEDPYVVYLNRPFVYAIVDTETGLPVFLGTVTNL